MKRKKDAGPAQEKVLGEKERIIVVGGSAGGVKALRAFVKGLPADFMSPVFIAWHMSPDASGILPELLGNLTSLKVAHALDYEPIAPGRIYVAPPDHHLLIEQGHVRVTRGPKENRFRPAIDPLFRSAAYAYRNRVIGVIVSGALDDGVAGLWTIKNNGGISIVQDPADADIPSMPQNALRDTPVDHCVPAADFPALLLKITQQRMPARRSKPEPVRVKLEKDIAGEVKGAGMKAFSLGDLSPFSCPECHGVLALIKEGNIIRYRCHTGHAYSADTLLSGLTEQIEQELYSAMRGMEESILLLNHMGDHYAEDNEPAKAAFCFKKAKEAEEQSQQVRNIIRSQEALTRERVTGELGLGKNKTA
ncbi:chemotaxis protein CheB [Niabella sp. 22666]|uniref:chemotaxis protein CheB n=1 Tax=Niabella sp. 22666 TaxID=3453954 RepID=UPI003F87AD39